MKSNTQIIKAFREKFVRENGHIPFYSLAKSGNQAPTSMVIEGFLTDVINQVEKAAIQNERENLKIELMSKAITRNGLTAEAIKEIFNNLP